MKRNYFKLLLIEPSFLIDRQLLENNYLELRKKYHPDMAKSASEKKIFLSTSFDLNNAYEILTDDFTRASYILSLSKIDINQYHSEKLKEMIRNVFEESEMLEMISEKKKLDKFLEEKKLKKRKLLLEMKDSFLKRDLDDFALQTIHLKYVNRLIQEAEKRV